MRTDPQVTRLIEALRAGDDAAFDRMLPLVYDELRRIAHRQLAGQPAGSTLDTTALVHESYLKLVAGEHLEWSDRAHFFAVAARAMRHILIDRARRRRTAKRGGAGGWRRIPLEEAKLSVDEQADALLALDAALERLAAVHPRQHQVVECRFFGGMTEAETAAAVGVTARTVRRDWLKARMWLYAELADEPEGPSEREDLEASDERFAAGGADGGNGGNGGG
ncbi:MAG: ECF-type sigma factor, partial [Gemmatimonadota bacterium]